LEFAVCFNKSASFLGKKTLLRQQTEGVSRRLVQFTLADSNAHPHSGEPIWWQDTLVGRTTSGAFGHTLGCAIALGYIRIAEQGLDAMLSTGGFEIEIACQRFPAQATLEAAYDSENLKPRM
jgi:4-methylaminobutanoate oxidase (formaldehyde-forming)